jgi:mono/diheme cytochrome c family protein
MNTGKQINAMVVTLFLLLISIGAYTVWDPFRSDAGGDEQTELAIERASTTFALNCRVCHGDRGQGGVEGGRFALAAPLDREELQGIDAGEFSQAALEQAYDFVYDTITCGRVGSPMPTWGQSEGGTLNEEQIRQLTVMITEGRWEEAQHHANELDADTVGHATLAMPDGVLPADATQIAVDNAAAFTLGQYIRIVIDEETEERMRILPLQLQVQRGAGGTAPAEHEAETQIDVPGFTPRDDEAPPGLAEDMDDETAVVVVRDLDPFAVGQTIQIDDELMLVTALERGIPTTQQFLAEDIGREPGTLLASGADNIRAGETIRIGGELMRVRAVVHDGETGIVLDTAMSAGSRFAAVTEPTFFSETYVFRVGDELVRVVGPLETDQLLAETIGRADSEVPITGTRGVAEGMVIRIGAEMMSVREIIEPASVVIERAVQETPGAAHAAGTAIVEVPPEPAEDEGAETTPVPPLADLDTGQRLIEPLDAEGTRMTVTGLTGISTDQLYTLGSEVVRVVEASPARLRVERAVDGTEATTHERRVDVFEANLLEVERGYGGTTASAHAEDDELFVAELAVERAVQQTELADHQKDDEIFLGNSFTVQRGVRETDPAEHRNGTLVLDFPIPPNDPPSTLRACGQQSEGGQTTAEPTVAGAQQVDVELTDEFEVTADPDSIATGAAQFNVSNDGAGIHNFRVVLTDLAPDALPLEGNQVDEDALTLGARSSNIPGRESATVTAQQLAPGAYVLFCNVPNHYESGMFTEFTVTP